MTDKSASSEFHAPADSSADYQSVSPNVSQEDYQGDSQDVYQDYSQDVSHDNDLHASTSAEDLDDQRIYFMNLSGDRDNPYLTKVTFEDKDDLTGEGREVLNTPLSSPVELSYRALHLFPVLDIDKDGIVSRVEMDSAAKDSKFTGTDAQVIAGLSEPSVWDRIANFSNDQRGKETGISNEDVWTIAERQNDVAVQTAYAAAIAKFHSGEMTAGN